MLSGAQSGDVGQALLAGNRDAAAELARGWAQALSRRLLPRAAANRSAGGGDADARGGATRRATRASGGRDPSGPVHRPRRIQRARGARVHRGGRDPREPAPPEAFHRAAVLQVAGRNAGAVRGPALRTGQQRRDRSPLQRADDAGQGAPAAVPDPRGRDAGRLHAPARAPGAGASHAQALPRPGERAAQAGAYARRLDYECDTIVQMGFSGYFLIVADFINWAKAHEIPVGPGRGSGAGSLVAYCAGHHRHRPDPLRACSSSAS